MSGWTPGATFDGLVVTGHLGKGGMGEVFLAEDVQTGTRYAVKTLSTIYIMLRSAQRDPKQRPTLS